MNVNIKLTEEEWRQVYQALQRENARQVEIGINHPERAVRDYGLLAEKVWQQSAKCAALFPGLVQAPLAGCNQPGMQGEQPQCIILC